MFDTNISAGTRAATTHFLATLLAANRCRPTVFAQTELSRVSTMLLQLAKEKKIVFFSGKGGVGKTTLAAATALAAAQQGQQVLLASTDPAHNLGHLFACTIGAEKKNLAPNLDAIELDPDSTVEQHLSEVTAVLRRLMPANLSGEIDKHMALAKNSPGMHEAAMLERIAEIAAQHQQYDLIVFDTAPSGHTARLMALPEMMSAWTDGLLKRQEKSEKLGKLLKGINDQTQGKKLFGDSPTDKSDGHVNNTDRDTQIRHILHRRKERFALLRDLITNTQTTGFIIVLAAERLPVLETIELHEQLKQTGVHVNGLVINKRIPVDSAGLLGQRRLQENEHLSTLQAALSDIPQHQIELVAHDIVGIAALAELAKKL